MGRVWVFLCRDAWVYVFVRSYFTKHNDSTIMATLDVVMESGPDFTQQEAILQLDILDKDWPFPTYCFVLLLKFEYIGQCALYSVRLVWQPSSRKCIQKNSPLHTIQGLQTWAWHFQSRNNDPPTKMSGT